MHDLLVYVKEGLSFPRDFRKLFRKRNGFLFVFLTGVNSFIVSILFRQSITVFVFVLGFSLLNFFTQTVNFLTLIPSCVSHNPALLDLFLPHDPSICSAVIFPLLGNCDQVGVSVSIDFPSNSKEDAPFHRTAYDCSRADGDGLRDHLRYVPQTLSLNWVLLLLLLNFQSGSSLKLVYISRIVNVRTIFIYLHGFQLLMSSIWLPWLIEITSFVFTSKINLLQLK